MEITESWVRVITDKMLFAYFLLLATLAQTPILQDDHTVPVKIFSASKCSDENSYLKPIIESSVLILNEFSSIASLRQVSIIYLFFSLIAAET